MQVMYLWSFQRKKNQQLPNAIPFEDDRSQKGNDASFLKAIFRSLLGRPFHFYSHNIHILLFYLLFGAYIMHILNPFENPSWTFIPFHLERIHNVNWHTDTHGNSGKIVIKWHLSQVQRTIFFSLQFRIFSEYTFKPIHDDHIMQQQKSCTLRCENL